MKYPFKFLDAYNKNDKDIFFGRDEEIEAMYRMVFQTNLMLVYGASGTGKTSLIRCGLANKFKSSQWLDLYIRREGNINTSLLKIIKNKTPKTVVEVEEEADDDWFEDLINEEDDNLDDEESNVIFESDNPIAQALNNLYLATFTPIYLIFDQFEEVFTLGDKTEQSEIVATIKVLIQLQLPVKIIIAIREEYLAKLYELEKEIPELRNKRLRIEPMNISRVEHVILTATKHDLTDLNPNQASNITLKKREEKQIAKAIVNKIREGDIDIQLPYLQVFMDRLYEEATGAAIRREKPAVFSLDLVNKLGKIGDVLVDFINRQSKVISKTLTQKYGELPEDIVWRILSPFSTADGTKKPIKSNDFNLIEENLTRSNFTLEDSTDASFRAFIKDAIMELERSRILRFRRESQTYEVYHDTLAKQIAEKRSEDEKAYLKAKRIITDGYAMYKDTNTLLSKDQLAFTRPFKYRLRREISAEAQYYVKKSKRYQKRRRRLISALIIVIFVIGIFANLTILNEQQKTQKALDNFIEEQRLRETGELDDLMKRVLRIITISDNCPPEVTMEKIEKLYHKYEYQAEEFKPMYKEMKMKLDSTDCLN